MSEAEAGLAACLLGGANGKLGTRREDPEGWVQGFSKVHLVLIHQADLFSDSKENDKAVVTVEKYTDPRGLGGGQSFLHVVVPGRDLVIEPFHTPRVGIPAQPALGALPLHAAVADAYAAEVVLLQLHLPVVNTLLIAVQPQDLRTVGEPLGMGAVMLKTLSHRSGGVVVCQSHLVVGSIVVEDDFNGI